jgi:hypothetical protein
MKQMSMKMEQSMEGAEMEQMEEDVKMLRQILDNYWHIHFRRRA